VNQSNHLVSCSLKKIPENTGDDYESKEDHHLHKVNRIPFIHPGTLFLSVVIVEQKNQISPGLMFYIPKRNIPLFYNNRFSSTDNLRFHPFIVPPALMINFQGSPTVIRAES